MKLHGVGKKPHMRGPLDSAMPEKNSATSVSSLTALLLLKEADEKVGKLQLGSRESSVDAQQRQQEMKDVDPTEKTRNTARQRVNHI